MARKFYIEDNEVIPCIKFELTAPAGFTEITDDATLDELYANKYDEYTEDGTIFYNSFRVSLSRAIDNGVTAEQAFETEAYLKDIKDELITGNWLTAQYICSNKAEFSLFDTTLKAEILGGITQYITDNY